jgi:hypothetical protein
MEQVELILAVSITPRSGAKTLDQQKPNGAIVLTAECACVCQGIATGTEVFNEIFSSSAPAHTTHSLSNPAKLVCVRAIAVAIRTHGTVLPTTELLLRHAIQ